MDGDWSIVELALQIDHFVAHRVDVIHLRTLDGDGLVLITPTVATSCVLVFNAGILLHVRAVHGRNHVASLPYRHIVQELTYGLVRWYDRYGYPVPTLVQCYPPYRLL